MPDAHSVNLPVLRRRYADVRAMLAAVRGLLEKLDFEEMKKSTKPSGRNLWESLSFWLCYRGPFLNIVEGVPHATSGVINAPRGYTLEQAWQAWDESVARADRIMATFSVERWNTDVDFWIDREKTRRMKAWEVFLAHFADRLEHDWRMMLEDICTVGHQKWLESLIGEDWYYFREGESLKDVYPQ
ncbi:MAG: hypothetical protein IPK87_11825 [Planctomycetes bacterium]|nr:hypothetical protein [Planctomycetota bacterium]